MAGRYANYPNVLYETYNEPLQIPWSTIKWSHEVDEAARDPVSGVNLAYTIHFYANTHREELRARVDSAKSSGVAVFATEWGTCSADGNGQLDLGSTNTWLNFLHGHNIGDANWAVADKNEACAALVPGASSNGGWSDGQLTESGRYMRASIRGGGSPSPSPSPGGGGCCRFEADCGDCGEDGTGWCHLSSSNCATCTGVFDPSAPSPGCNGGGPGPGPGPSPPSPPSPPVGGGGCCRFEADC